MNMGRKEGCCAPFVGSWVPSNTIWPGPKPPSAPSGILVHLAVWPQQTWAENWGCAPFWRGAWSTSNTMRARPRPTYLRAKFHLDPSNRLGILKGIFRTAPPFTSLSPFLSLPPLLSLPFASLPFPSLPIHPVFSSCPLFPLFPSSPSSLFFRTSYSFP